MRYLLIFLLLGIANLTATLHLKWQDASHLQVDVAGDRYQVDLLSEKVSRIVDAKGSLQELQIDELDRKLIMLFYPDSGKMPPLAAFRQLRKSEKGWMPVGLSATLAISGQLLVEEWWQEGRLHGKRYIRAADEVILAEEEYEEGIPIGRWLYKDEKGQLLREILYPTSLEKWSISTAIYKADEEAPAGLLVSTALRTVVIVEEIAYPSKTSLKRSAYLEKGHVVFVE